jgi:predicted dehydrogenase
MCKIVGVADIHFPAAQERAGQFGATAFEDYGELLDKARPDAISICTPPHMHLPVAQAAAQRRVAVLCEKPPARTLAETQAIVAAMTQSNTLLQFAFCHRFHQPVMQARTLIAGGKLGQVVQIYNRFGFRFARAGQSWFTEREVAGGGILIDTLVHSIDIFRTLVGEVASVAAATSMTLPAIKVEDSASLLVIGVKGTLGVLTCSWVTPISEAEIRIYGTEGEVIIDYAQSEGLRYKLTGDVEWTQLPFDQQDRFVQQAQHFLDCVSTGRQPSVTGQDGIAVMKVVDAAYSSAQQDARSVEVLECIA